MRLLVNGEIDVSDFLIILNKFTELDDRLNLIDKYFLHQDLKITDKIKIQNIIKSNRIPNSINLKYIYVPTPMYYDIFIE